MAAFVEQEGPAGGAWGAVYGKSYVRQVLVSSEPQSLEKPEMTRVDPS